MQALVSEESTSRETVAASTAASARQEGGEGSQLQGGIYFLEGDIFNAATLVN